MALGSSGEMLFDTDDELTAALAADWGAAAHAVGRRPRACSRRAPSELSAVPAPGVRSPRAISRHATANAATVK
jgi:hypothetical protein